MVLILYPWHKTGSIFLADRQSLKHLHKKEIQKGRFPRNYDKMIMITSADSQNPMKESGASAQPLIFNPT